MQLRSKLTLAFIAVALLATTLAATAAGLATRNLFAAYIRENNLARAIQWRNTFAAYYSRNGGWDGVQTTFFNTGTGHMRGKGHGRNAVAGETVLLADRDGQIVAASQTAKLGQHLSASSLAEGLPITAGGRNVGTVLATTGSTAGLYTLEDDFAHSVRRAIILGGILATILTGALGILLSRRLTRPLTDLAATVQRFSRRDFSQRCPVTADDEFGALASTFNSLAESSERYERMRRSLVADVAHELRTPLSVLRGNLEMLQDGVSQPDPETISSLHDEVLRMTRLVTDLQELSLAEAGALTLRRENISLRSLLEKTLSGMTAAAAAGQVALKMQIPADLPPVFADPDRIAQVILNLTGNSLRHTPAGGRITVAAAADSSCAAVSVRDTGSGISPENLPYIFDRFYRADKARTRAGGAGLGLAIAKSLVEAHGGTIRAASTPGQGTTITFTLPLAGENCQQPV